MKTHKKKILVIGHKNPDTDSVCSAIAYTNLKNKLTNKLHVAKVAGEINAETEFVLSYFGIEKPDYIDDVSTQVKDIDIHEVEGIEPLMSIKDAWSLMRQDHLYTLPICSPEGYLDGIITNSDIAHVILDFSRLDILATSHTPYTNILKTLDATLFCGDIEGKTVESGKIVIADDNPELMEEYIEKGDIVILGNRYESQLCAIEMEAACIIISEGTKVTKTIQKIAEQHNCIVMVSPLPTFTIARLINQSMPVNSFMTKDNILYFHTDAFIDEIKNTMAKHRFRDFPILDHKNIYRGMISRRNLMDMTKKKVILVDHNELDQAVDGILDAELLEIIDHHRLGTITTVSPMVFRNQPLGCTATIIYQIYKENDLEIDKKDAGLLASAILSDTLLFKSPTCTEIDKNACEELAAIAGINIEEYANEMFMAGSNLKSKSAEEIFFQDYKKFTVGEISFGVGQVNSISEIELKGVEEKINSYIKEHMKSASVDLLFYMLTDINKSSTKVLFSGSKAKELMEEAFGIKASDDSLYLEGVVSRKKQFIPALMVALQQ